MTVATVAMALGLFVGEGVCEIGGGWMVWRWRREGGGWWWAVVGAALLVAYGVVATFQRQSFGRSYAAYGGFFMLLSLLWGWALDGTRPDVFDWTGAAIVLVGAAIIFFAPRSSLHHHPSSSSSLPSTSPSSPSPAPAPSFALPGS